jgi:hypothetical protein
MDKHIFRKILINALGLVSVLGLLGCFYIYRTLQPMLIPANAVITPEMDRLGGWPVPILFLTAIYHVFLLLFTLQRYQSEPRSLFLHSLYVVALILSGINILTDITILTDIGHEYPFWDVSGYWIYLYLCNAFHVLVVGIGLVLNRNVPPVQLRDLFQQIRSGDDAIFRSLHQIGLISACIGIIGMIWVILAEVTERFEAAYLLVAVVFALFPRMAMLMYWGIRNSKKPVQQWMDEKQFSDMAFGSLIMTSIAMPLIVVAAILSAVNAVNFPAYAWLMLVFLIMLLIHSLVMVLKNKEENEFRLA